MNSGARDGRRNQRGSGLITPPPRRDSRPAEEEELETGEPIPDDEQPAPKKIPGRRYATNSRPEVSRAPAPGGQMVLSTAKYLPASAFDDAPSSSGRKHRCEPGADGSPQTLEGRVWNGGVWGGLLAMTVAFLWFVVGLMNDYIYFYPPILFVIGLGGFFKGLNGRE